MQLQNKILIRNFKFKDDYQYWIKNYASSDIDALRQVFEHYLLKNNNQYGCFERGQGYIGFLWKEIEVNINYPFIMDFWREKIVKLAYYNYLSDQKTEFLDGGARLMIDRHYLKPLAGIQLNKTNELNFGNVVIEAGQNHQGQFLFLKLLVMQYPQNTYLSFENLLKELFIV